MTIHTMTYVPRKLRASFWQAIKRPALLACLFAATTIAFAESATHFDIPAGEAISTLKQAAQQAGLQVMYPADTVNGVETNAVQGDFTPRQALDRMLKGTDLFVVQDEKSGAFSVQRVSDPNVQGASSAVVSSDRPAKKASTDSDSVDQTITLGAVEVTGSHIKRLEGEGPAPVLSFSNADIARSGAITLGEFMQSLPINNGTQGTIDLPSGVSGQAYARGATTINPRGLGAERFLVLVNGRRAVTYGSPDTSGDSVFDFNSIPAEAVDSVDYLKDGASAIYGSDAITGVMNIKLKKNYTGLSTELMVGDVAQGSQGGNPWVRSANVLAGVESKGTSIMVDINWFKQNDNIIKDYARSRSTDFSVLGYKGINDNSTGNWPYNITLTAAQATAAGLTTGAGFYGITGGQPTSNPTLASFTNFGSSGNTPNANRYDFGPTSQLTPSQNNLRGLIELTHDFNSNLSAFGQIVFSDDRTHFLYTPNSISSTADLITPSILLPTTQTLAIPANNPYNPFGIALTNFKGRAIFGPTRTFDVESTAGSFLAGLNGKIGPSWSWTSALSYGYNLVDQDANNAIRAVDMQAALNGTLAGYVGKFLNPFGVSDPGLTNALFVTSVSNSKDSAVDYDLSASGSLFTLPAWFGQAKGEDVSLAVGGEWRHESLDNNSDTTNYLVNSGLSPFRAGRTVTAEFAELDIPIAGKYLDAQIAARHDKYNDFGGTTNPKFALVTQPLSFLKLRGSYSQSFKAPDLGQLHLAPLTTYSLTIADPQNPGLPTNSYPVLSGGNPNLKPEKGKVWYEGGVIDLDKFVPGLSLSVDYFSFKIANVITSFTNTTQLFTYFPSLVVRNGDGTINHFNEIPINAANYYWRGYDLGLLYNLRKTVIGEFSFSLAATRLNYFAYDGGVGLGPINKAGQYNTPRWNGNVQTHWSKGPYSASLGLQYKGKYLDNANAPTAVWGVNAKTLLNGTVTYNIVPWTTKVTFGCDNIMNIQPPPDGYASPSNGFDISTYAAWAMGRFVTLKVKKEF